jgi:HEAT repeat protein
MSRRLAVVALAVSAGAHVLCCVAEGAGRWDEWDARVASVTRERTYRLLQGRADFAQVRDVLERALSGDVSAVPALVGLVSDRDERVAMTAAQLLGRFPSASNSTVLKKTYAEDERLLVRGQALTGLVRMGDAEAAGLVTAALSSEDPGIQGTGLAAVEAVGDGTYSAVLLGFLDRQQGAIAPEWLQLLGRLGDPPGSTAVRERLLAEANNKDRHFDVRVGAAKGLEKMGLAGSGPVRRILDLHLADGTCQSLLVVEGNVEKLSMDEKVAIKDQGDLDALLREADLGRHRLDAWKRPFRLKFVSVGVFHLVSDGPDGMPDTADDISSAERWGDYQARVFGDLFVGVSPQGR